MVGDSIKFVSKRMGDMPSSNGTKIVTSNPFDVLNMVEKDDEITLSDSVNAKDEDGNIGNTKVFNLDNEDNDSENEVEEDANDTGRCMESIYKAMKTSKSTGAIGMMSLYERWKDNYDNLTKVQLAFCDAYDIRVHGHTRRK